MLFLPVMFLIFSVLAWWLITRGFSRAVFWIVESGCWYSFWNGYELWWEGVSQPILLAVGILCLSFFVFSAIMGFLAHQRKVRSG